MISINKRYNDFMFIHEQCTSATFDAAVCFQCLNKIIGNVLPSLYIFNPFFIFILKNSPKQQNRSRMNVSHALKTLKFQKACVLKTLKIRKQLLRQNYFPFHLFKTLQFFWKNKTHSTEKWFKFVRFFF